MSLKLGIVQEVERTALRSLDVEEVVTAICQAVGQTHEVEVDAVCLIKPSSIPKTSSGKIQRRGCAKQFKEQTLNVVAEWRQSEAEKSATEMIDL